MSLILPDVKWYRISLGLGKVAPAARRSGLATVVIVLSTGGSWAVINGDKHRRLGRTLMLRYLPGPLPYLPYQMMTQLLNNLLPCLLLHVSLAGTKMSISIVSIVPLQQSSGGHQDKKLYSKLCKLWSRNCRTNLLTADDNPIIAANIIAPLTQLMVSQI